MTEADAPTEDQSRRRPVRSFVLRQGRVSPAQARALNEGMPRFGVPYGEALLDLPALFGRQAPTILEIGFGMGETTARIAAAHPEQNFLGVEVHTPGVGALLKRASELGLANLRVVQHDAVEVLRHMIAPGSLAAAHVFFPDPWPKKRHHKRRLLQAAFVHLLAERLAPDAYLHVATDWQDYAQEILATLNAEALLINTAPDFAPRPEYRPLTKFEQRGLALGHGVWDLVFRRTGG
ncbi:MAG: tRNA (guanosine(46)-N7)-methyltransferase TrmB [Betaproteobacteria bacterium]|nr:tRNA (guanosine(46)-N7)-methyltransferase TrmB [Betaproteobacteria bacterium]